MESFEISNKRELKLFLSNDCGNEVSSRTDDDCDYDDDNDYDDDDDDDDGADDKDNYEDDVNEEND